MGRSNKACTAAHTELAILTKHDSPEDNNLANAYSNVGYALLSVYKAAEGIKYLDTAVAMARAHAEPACYREYNIDRFLRNRGRCRQQMKQFDQARRDFLEAEYFQAKIHGPDSHYDGETKHERAKLAAAQGNLLLAAQLSSEAQALVSTGKPTHASVMAALYRRGCVAMLQGSAAADDDDTALQHLEKALVIYRINEPHRGNGGESARVQWRISQIWERKGRREEAGRLREEAERVKTELLATGDYAVVGGDEEAGWDALVGLLYR
ncbi:hypothetical protein C8A00DRAFT_30962 [Chaetomidium leptoderma]|uniref:TPR-like protein n=1 Tax=Chaetomidium leptoderma TaxID=669021 RepID=A0AAN6VTH3_9PEZI|nr:hypothetical protein C8A00DRAFT_30962 [Chaetomidium leptoderma]